MSPSHTTFRLLFCLHLLGKSHGVINSLLSISFMLSSFYFYFLYSWCFFVSRYIYSSWQLVMLRLFHYTFNFHISISRGRFFIFPCLQLCLLFFIRFNTYYFYKFFFIFPLLFHLLFSRRRLPSSLSHLLQLSSYKNSAAPYLLFIHHVFSPP